MISEHLRISQCKMATLRSFGKTAEKAGSDWKWIPRLLEIFSLLLMHLCKRNGNFCLLLDSCQSLAGKQNSCYQKTWVHIQLKHLMYMVVSSAEQALHQWHHLSGLPIASQHQAWESFWINNLSCLWGHYHVVFPPEQKQDLAEKQLLNLG